MTLREKYDVERKRVSKRAFSNHLLRESGDRVWMIQKPYEDQVELIGQVLEVDVKRGRFQLWRNGHGPVHVAFSEEQESQVTEALGNHQTRRLLVAGTAEFAPDGTALRMTAVDRLEILPAEPTLFDQSARPIWEEIEELVSQVPAEEWEKLPDDLSFNLDHYIYGTPKR